MKYSKLLLVCLSTLATHLSSIVSAQPNQDFETKLVGDQEWMIKNLNVSQFRNGNPIPEANSKADWAVAAKEGKPAWCYADYDQTNEKKYGKLYNWFAISDERGLAPDGYHIPSKEEWQALAKSIPMEASMITLRNNSGWPEGQEGTNETGFSGLPGGYVTDKGAFSYFGIQQVGQAGWWWSTTAGKKNATAAALAKWTEDQSASQSLPIFNVQGQLNKGFGLSIRCIKN